MIIRPVGGANITTTIDADLQEALGTALHGFMKDNNFHF